jgi:hypothetical protein
MGLMVVVVAAVVAAMITSKTVPGVDSLTGRVREKKDRGDSACYS